MIKSSELVSPTLSVVRESSPFSPVKTPRRRAIQSLTHSLEPGSSAVAAHFVSGCGSPARHGRRSSEIAVPMASVFCQRQAVGLWEKHVAANGDGAMTSLTFPSVLKKEFPCASPREMVGMLQAVAAEL